MQSTEILLICAMKKSKTVTKPLIYFGGKGNLKKRISQLIPQTQIYCEPFCGGASLFFFREPSPVEFLNDLDQNVVNLYRVLQNPETNAKLRDRIAYTLYSRAEFDLATENLKNPKQLNQIELAWSFFVKQNQGFSGLGKTWGRALKSSSRGMASTCSKWQSRQNSFDLWLKRLQQVQIECRPAIDLINFRGNAIVSTYPNPIYSDLKKWGYEKHEFLTSCHAVGRTRTSKILGKGSATALASRTELVYRRIH